MVLLHGNTLLMLVLVLIWVIADTGVVIIILGIGAILIMVMVALDTGVVITLLIMVAVIGVATTLLTMVVDTGEDTDLHIMGLLITGVPLTEKDMHIIRGDIIQAVDLTLETFIIKEQIMLVIIKGHQKHPTEEQHLAQVIIELKNRILEAQIIAVTLVTIIITEALTEIVHHLVEATTEAAHHLVEAITEVVLHPVEVVDQVGPDEARVDNKLSTATILELVTPILMLTEIHQ